MFTLLMKLLLKSLLLLLIFTCSHSYGQETANGVKFVENKGQWPSQVHFKSDVPGGKIWLEDHKISYQFTQYPNLHANFKFTGNPKVQQHVVWAEFVDVNENFTIEKKAPSKEYTNYFLGNDKSKWVSNAHSYADIKYVDYYKNTDLRVYQHEGQLKYDFIIKPNGKNNIQIKYSGQDKIKLNRKGELIIETTLGQVIEEKPYAYQLIDGEQKEIPCQFILKKNVVSFSIGKYDSSTPLVIDPVLVFASYSGSTADNFGMTATYGTDGSLFAGGTAFNTGYPNSSGAYDSTFAGTPSSGITDIVISRYEPLGTSLIYSTYIGGTEAETVHSLVVNENNELYLYGVTGSSNFPVQSNGYDTSFNGGSLLRFIQNGTYFNNGTDIYVAKLNASGTVLSGSTYIGGSGNDGVNYSNVLNSFNLGGGVIVSSPAYDSLQNNYGDQYRGEIFLDENSNCYITSSSRSIDFPTPNGFDASLGGIQDGVVLKLNADLSSLIWSSYIGGDNMDAGFGIRVDTNEVVYISGGTSSSSDFPITPGTLNQTYQGGDADGYLAKIANDGSSILAATYLGTSEYDQCYFIDIDRFGSVYTLGQTRGSIPIVNATYSNPNSSSFIIKVDSSLTTLAYSTVFGNGNLTASFSPSAFLVDRCQNVYVSGWGGNILTGSNLSGMPTTANAFLPNSPNGFDFYLIVLERDLQSLLYGTYFGGATSQEHVDGGTSRFDKNGVVYQSVCAGCGGYNDFPIEPDPGAWSTTNESSNCNNGVFKFDFEIIPKAQFSVNQFQGCAPLDVTFTNTSNGSDTYLWDFGGGDTTSQVFSPTRNYTTPGTFTVSLLIQDSICNTIDTAFQTIIVNPPVSVTGGNTFTTCEDTITLSISTTGPITEIVWSSTSQFTDTLNTTQLDTNLYLNLLDTNWYYVIVSNGSCLAVDSFLVNYTGYTTTLLNDTICEGNSTTLNIAVQPLQSINHNWAPLGSIVSGENTANPIVNPTITTTFFDTTANTVGCIVIDSLTVEVFSQITITGGNIRSACDTTTLEIGTTGQYDSITWSTNNGFTDLLNTNPLATSLLVEVKEATWFYVMVTNGFCSAADSFLVNYIGFDLNTVDTNICNGERISIETIPTPAQTLSYSWSPTSEIISGANTAIVLVNPSTTTAYTVIAQNNLGCIDSTTSSVFVSGFDPNLLSIFADKDTLINGESTQLHILPDSGFTYQWNPSSFLNNANISDPITSPIFTTSISYTVLLSEISTGCPYYKTITIYAFELLCDEPHVFLPNAFTPNGDAENDILRVRGRTIEKMYLKIYDRWGELVFETNQQAIGWDGTYKEDLVDPGVFVYHLEVTCIDGQEYFKKGNVTVIR